MIRSLAIIMVVAFHAYGMMMAEAHFPESVDAYRELYYNMNNLILKFRMPLFIFISGYLFSHLENDRGKYGSFTGLLKNKFKRLIIPFLFFSTVFMLSINNFHWDTYIRMGYQHLWFIPMLFWCFITTRVIMLLPFTHNRIAWSTITVVAFIGVISGDGKFSAFGAQYLIMWYFWFWFGYNLYFKRTQISSYINRHQFIIVALLICLFAGTAWYKCVILRDEDIQNILTETGNISAIILIWYAVNALIINSNNKWAESKWLAKLNKYSYGIFVFHNWIQPFMISSTVIAVFGLDALAAKHTVLFPFAFFVSSFLLSLGLSWMVLKTRFGRFLIG